MSENLRFIDILEPRRQRGDVFSFLTKYWDPQKTFSHNINFSPQALKEKVLNSMYIDSVLEAESIRTGIHKENLRKTIVEYLEEMGLDKKVYVIRWIGIIFLKIALMMRVRVFVNDAAILQLKKSMGSNPVLFLPTHRSYADFCLMTYLCFHYDIDFPAVAAGMDFHSMAVLGRRMRETCAFFIRRTLVGAPLYAATLARYVRALVTHHAAPIEFFLEGTRSRSNKSLYPKYGMLSMSLAPLFAGQVSDVTIVPVNISYDRLMEQGLFAYEHLGLPKPKESTGGFLKALNTLNDHFGSVYINLGQPMSVKEFFANRLRFTEETANPVELQQLTAEQFELVQELANHVIALQQTSTVVTISNLVALALMHSVVLNKPLSIDDLLTEIEWVIDVLRRLGASVFETDVKNSIERILLVHRKMMKLDADNNLRLIHSDGSVITNGNMNNMKGHTLKPTTMATAVSVIQLQLYVNPVLHYLAPAAVLTAIVARGAVTAQQLASDYQTVRKLLKYEIFILEKDEDLVYNNALQFCLDNKVIVKKGDLHVSGDATKLTNLLKLTIWPSLTTLFTCIEVLIERGECEHKLALRLIQARVEQNAQSCHPYCLSLEASANCLTGLHSASAVLRQRRNEEVFYSVVPGTTEETHRLVKSVLPVFPVAFDSTNSVFYNQHVHQSRL